MATITPYKLLAIPALSLLILVSCTTKIPVARQHYVDQTNLRIAQEEGTITKVLFGDLDRDGDPDIIAITDSDITNKQIVFFANDGRGHFTNNTLTRIPELYKKFQEIRLIDVNGDEALDILLLGGTPDKDLASTIGQEVNAESKNDYLLINDKSGVFIDETAARLPKIGNGYEEVKSADIDTDGDIDLLVTGSNVPSLLLLNSGRGIFKDETLSRIPTLDKGVQEALLGDVDSDGDIDIFFAMENRKNILLLNNGKGIFSNETEIMLPKVIDNVRDAAMSDLDNDGDLDIVVVVDQLTTELEKTKKQKSIEKYEPFSNANFEQGRYSPGWVNDNAWVIWSVNKNIELDYTKPASEEGTFYAVSFNPEGKNTGEEADGAVRSNNFTVPFNAKTLDFLKTGWDGQFGDKQKNFFYLKRSSDDKILKEAKPPLMDAWELHVWDVTDISGETVYFQAVDDNTDPSYASIGFDSLKLSNATLESERWEKGENYILINNGNGMFKDEPLSTSFTRTSYRVDVFDADNDNDTDIFIFGIYGASLLINDGYGSFRDETYARLPNADTDFGEIAYEDIDNDGDIDIVAINVGLSRLLINELNPKIIQEDIQKLKDLIVSFPSKFFREGKLDVFISVIGQKGGLKDLIDQAEVTELENVREKFFNAAIKKLQRDFLNRSDGCSVSGKPDSDDWITDCSAQLQVGSLVLDTIEAINSLLKGPPPLDKKVLLDDSPPDIRP